ncbi:MAG: hypothetical protein M1836_001046 [Candelina mexicana]|nr:MAG: hypothetical protein M1836_001046 [Candelina mexicana]
MTVGIMCSCVTTFPGFFRHHRPQIQSLIAHIKQSFRCCNGFISKRRHTSGGSVSNHVPRIATDDVKITLGSRISGNGHFISSHINFDAAQSNGSYNPPIHGDYCTMTRECSPSPHDEAQAQRDSKRVWWKPLITALSSRGYWDIVDIFSTRGTGRSTEAQSALSMSGQRA